MVIILSKVSSEYWSLKKKALQSLQSTVNINKLKNILPSMKVNVFFFNLILSFFLNPLNF